MLISCFLKRWQYHQYKFQTFPNICGILLYCEHKSLSDMHIPFIALNVGTPDRFRKGDILSSSFCHAASQPCDFLNRRMFVQRIRQNVSCRNFGGISLMRSRNITVFRNIVCILITNGHVISTLARRFRQILRVCSKTNIFENYMDKSRIKCLLKLCMVGYGLSN